MVIVYDLIVSFIVIIPIVVLQLGASLNFLSSWRSYEIDLRVVKNLLLFIVGQLVGEVY